MSFQTTYGSDGRLRVAILGCTGSIGTQALDVCRQHADRLQVTALSVNSSTSELVAAAREFSVPAVAVADVAHGDDAVLQELPEGTKLGVGAQAVCELARRDDVDCVLVAIVGAAGLEASHAALTSNTVVGELVGDTGNRGFACRAVENRDEHGAGHLGARPEEFRVLGVVALDDVVHVHEIDRVGCPLVRTAHIGELVGSRLLVDREGQGALRAAVDGTLTIRASSGFAFFSR